MPNLAANLQGMLVGLGISGSGSQKRKETWRQQFESAPGYKFIFLGPASIIFLDTAPNFSKFWINKLASFVAA